MLKREIYRRAAQIGVGKLLPRAESEDAEWHRLTKIIHGLSVGFSPVSDRRYLAVWNFLEKNLPNDELAWIESGSTQGG